MGWRPLLAGDGAAALDQAAFRGAHGDQHEVVRLGRIQPLDEPDIRGFLLSREHVADPQAAGPNRRVSCWACSTRRSQYSRAAREFLDSLIEMEKSFAEKVRVEQGAALLGGPESLAALEAMKKRFYDELNHRMETFFARQAT